jgi:glutaminase
VTSQPIVESPIQQFVETLYRRYCEQTDGALPDYIPELAKANPAWFGICLVTVDGQVYAVGDTEQPFTIQSISKPFLYGLALEQCGLPHVLSKIGVEPSGDAFNAISLHPQTGRPANPMINAGAIATTALVQGASPEARLQAILDMFGRYTGHPMGLDEAVYHSESKTGHRNRAIGYLLRNFSIIEEDPTSPLELYFQQCSVAVTCQDLAMMAATLANGGKHPTTGVQAVDRQYVPNVLSVMTSSGMYDYAGEWVYRVGLPAKSGVSGGILAILPGQLGIGVFSPLLDPHGNSVRGIQVLQELSQAFNLHLFDAPIVSQSLVRARYNATQISSRRTRTRTERACLDQHGGRILIYALQGELRFAACELVIRDIIARQSAVDAVILDLGRVVNANLAVGTLLLQLHAAWQACGKALLLAGVKASVLADAVTAAIPTFGDYDAALEWCENGLLQRHLPPASVETVPLAEFELCQGLSAASLERLAGLLQPLHFDRGDSIIRNGDQPDYLYFLTRGEVEALVPTADGGCKRVTTIAAGLVFGEMAIIDRSPRSATIVATTPVACLALSMAVYDRLEQDDPLLKLALLTNITRRLSYELRKAMREIAVYG